MKSGLLPIVQPSGATVLVPARFVDEYPNLIDDGGFVQLGAKGAPTLAEAARAGMPLPEIAAVCARQA